LYALNDTTPPKPALIRTRGGHGSCIEVEVWEMPVTNYGSFVAAIPSPLGIGTLTLEDGEQVQGFLCEQHATQGRPDITALGGWRNYIRTISAPSPNQSF
jgi:allophanate hydrolase